MTKRPICETPGCGRPIPKGGEGHPEICPTCLECLRVNGQKTAVPGRVGDEELDALRTMVGQLFRVPQQDARDRMLDYLARRFRSAR